MTPRHLLKTITRLGPAMLLDIGNNSKTPVLASKSFRKFSILTILLASWQRYKLFFPHPPTLPSADPPAVTFCFSVFLNNSSIYKKSTVIRFPPPPNLTQIDFTPTLEQVSETSWGFSDAHIHFPDLLQIWTLSWLTSFKLTQSKTSSALFSHFYAAGHDGVFC